jgi:hypothetical protein
VHGRTLAEDDVRRDRLEPLGHARIMHHNECRCARYS